MPDLDLDELERHCRAAIRVTYFDPATALDLIRLARAGKTAEAERGRLNALLAVEKAQFNSEYAKREAAEAKLAEVEALNAGLMMSMAEGERQIAHPTPVSVPAGMVAVPREIVDAFLHQRRTKFLNWSGDPEYDKALNALVQALASPPAPVSVPATEKPWAWAWFDHNGHEVILHRPPEADEARSDVIPLYQCPVVSSFVPTGMKLVPNEPTEELFHTYWQSTGESLAMKPRTDARFRGLWAALLTALSATPSQEPRP